MSRWCALDESGGGQASLIVKPCGVSALVVQEGERLGEKELLSLPCWPA